MRSQLLIKTLLDNFEKIKVGDVFIIGINLTRLTLNEASEFRTIVEEVVNYGHSNLVIDLSQSYFIDSTFFGSLIIALKLITGKGYKMKVLEPANSGEDIFTTKNFRRLFDLYKTRADAIKSFERESKPEN